MNLSERFYYYLLENDFKEFTTTEARRWYQQNRRGKGRVYYDYIYYLILKPLLDKGLIRRVFTGNYLVVSPTPNPPKNPAQTPITTTTLRIRPYRMQQEQPPPPENDEDREFFEYLQRKIQGKEV